MNLRFLTFPSIFAGTHYYSGILRDARRLSKSHNVSKYDDDMISQARSITFFSLLPSESESPSPMNGHFLEHFLGQFLGHFLGHSRISVTLGYIIEMLEDLRCWAIERIAPKYAGKSRRISERGDEKQGKTKMQYRAVSKIARYHWSRPCG